MKNIFFLLLLATSFAQAQTTLLERKISITLRGESVDASLQKIASAGGFVFSYNPVIFRDKQTVTERFVNKPVREVLDKIFKGTIQYKVRGNYIILTAASKSTANEPAIVTGYVVDESTGERLRDVSIYDPVTLTSTISDSAGYFEMKIEKPADEIILSVNLQNYYDTIVTVQGNDRLNIPIRINREKMTVLADSVSRKLRRFWLRQSDLFSKMNRQRINIRNIDDTLYRTSQVSLVPFVGTNHKMSGHVINDLSFNVFGGYSLGVERVEIGGLFNLVRGNVNGVQVAGLFNQVGGGVSGVQFAGIFNVDRGLSRGAQFAGVFNVNTGVSAGLAMAGVANISSSDKHGPQFAGVLNIASRDVDAAQLAGVFNVAGRSMKGFQAAGVFNVAGKAMRGTQLSGVFNIAGGEMKGAQIAGVINVAKKVKGLQLGLVNIADSVKGIPIGLMSIVGKGYHKIEISADEIFYTNVAFRTGVRHFYNILTAGAKPSTYREEETVWTFGYGLGTAPRISKKLFLNFDLTANQIVEGNRIEAVNLLNKFYVGFDYQFLKKVSLTFGATVNGYITRRSVDNYPALFTDYEPDIFYDRDFGSNYNMKMWMGAKVGLRFL